MSKITFRADADLVDRLEALEGSKSEVMREALRGYLDGTDEGSGADGTSLDGDERAADESVATLDGALADRVDELVTARLDEVFGSRGGTGPASTPARPFGVPDPSPPVTLTVNVDGAGVDVDRSTDGDPTADDTDTAADSEPTDDAAPSDGGDAACAQCGEGVSDDHVFCPNCGEKASRRVFCECGDEVRSDWSFCPGCGRRTAAADVLDR